MEIIICHSQKKFDITSAAKVMDQVKEKSDSVLGLATGITPKGMYKVLVDRINNEMVDFSHVKTFNLDEYANVDINNPGTCKSYLLDRFINKIKMNKENVNFINSEAEELEIECMNYENKIKSCGGIDLLILGIGQNGHLGFNEPGTPFNTLTHVVKLTDITKENNTWSFGTLNKVPDMGITMGIRTIMNAKKLLLLASGRSKMHIVNLALNGNITTEVPASVIQLHPNVSVILDKEALEEC